MSKSNNVIESIISTIILIGLIIFLYPKVTKLFENKNNDSQYNSSKIYSIGDTLSCPNFDITIDKVQIKKKGTKIDSYQVINNPEWIGVTLTVKNKSGKTKSFYSSDVSIINSSGEVLEHSWLTYSIWGVELLGSPELVSGGSKKGYIQFSNTNTDNSNLILKVDCNAGLFENDVIYKVNISQ